MHEGREKRMTERMIAFRPRLRAMKAEEIQQQVQSGMQSRRRRRQRKQ